MSHRTETARSTALAKIKEAEEADYFCFLEHVKEDLGTDLSAWLDCSTTYQINSIDVPQKWALGIGCAALALRMPDCTEIMVWYNREAESQPPSHRTPALAYGQEMAQAYLAQGWVRHGWGLPGTGRFAAVSYVLDYEGIVKADITNMYNAFFLTNEIDHAKLAAKKFYQEKLDLEKQAKRKKEQEIEERLRRFR